MTAPQRVPTRALRRALLCLTTTACAMPSSSSTPSPAPAPSAARDTTGEHVDASGVRRTWRLHVPPGANDGARRPLLVMLHGCTQDAADIARGTRMDARADARGLLVLYPEQPAAAHPQKCWSWYAPAHQRRDAGEPAAIAAMTRAVMASHAVDPRRVYVAGISAGGAMALTTAAAYPETYAAIAVHSALPFGAATSVPDALVAMRQGADTTRASGDALLAAMGERGRAIPGIVFHGATDAVAHPANGRAIARQLAALHGRFTSHADIPRTETRTAGGRTVERTVHVGGGVELWTVQGLGHAWSGGDPAGTYTDAAGPDAAEEMLRFLLAHALPGPAHGAGGGAGAAGTDAP